MKPLKHQLIYIPIITYDSGKITYYTHPPEEHKMPAHISSEIVSEWSQAFDIVSSL